MKTLANMLATIVILTGLTIPAVAQSATAGIQDARAASPPATSTGAGPAVGMTREQAGQILKELKAIHRLLERQQTPGAQAQAFPSSDHVQMDVEAGWHSQGREDAPVTVVEFADYQCPFCRKFQSETFAELKKDYIDTGKVRFVSRDLPLDFHANAPNSAVAARCAGEQNKFWEMRDLMLARDADLAAAALRNYKQINLDTTAFDTCLGGNKYSAAIQRDMADASALGIRGTPSFVVGKTSKDKIRGKRIAGAVPFSVFETAIKDQLSPTGSAVAGSLHISPE